MTDPLLVPAHTDAVDDLTLARRIAGGERAAFELLMRRHNRRLYRLARATLRSDADAQDALQDAYISAFRSIGSFRGDAALLTWLSRLVLNECFGRERKRARRENIIPMVDASPDTDLDIMTAPDPDPPYQAAARAEMRTLLERKLDELPAAFRVVFVLRSVEEMSVEETAECLGIPEATVRTRHFRAKSLLRESLAREADLTERDLYEFGGGHCDRVVASVFARLQGEEQGSA
jgi:RNA polymerase sigma-70 factor (ECF subfamily)